MAELAALEQKSTDQFAVVTVKSLEGYPIEDYGYRLGRKWGIGQKGKDNGILLIVAPNERKVRIEVGRGLEPVMTDAMSSLIIQNAILPEFRRGDFSAGIRAGVRDIKDVLLGDAEEVKERARQASDALDFWQIALIIFWICVVLFVLFAVVQSINQCAASGRRPPRAARRAGRRTGKLRRLGRRLVGRRWRRRRMVRRRRRLRRRRVVGKLVMETVQHESCSRPKTSGASPRRSPAPSGRRRARSSSSSPHRATAITTCRRWSRASSACSFPGC